MVEETGRPSGKMIAYFEARARGGVGLITSGLVPVSPESDPAIPQRGGLAFLPRINGSRSVFAGWRDLAGSIHAHGARFFIQLTAGLGRVGSPECITERWRLPVSASWSSNFYVPQIPCRPLSDRECRRISQAAGQAALDARECGIDGVHLHGHEGYLLEQLTNPAFNHRRFGRYADWQMFGLDLVREIRRRCGPRYPIMYRIDLSLALAETYGARMNEVPQLRRLRGGRSVAMSLSYIRNLITAGIDLIDVDLGCYENWWLPHPPSPMPPGSFLAVAKLVKDYLKQEAITSNAGLPVPVVAVGKLGYPDLAERALRDELCDMVMLARPLLADPDWPRKAFAGRVQDITPCIGDQEACLTEIVHGGHLQCAVNPRAGFEERFPAAPQRIASPKRIAVIGAGPSGITCACIAAERGHDLVLFERDEKPGGWLRAGSAPAIKFDVANYLAHLEHRLADSARAHGLRVELSSEVTSERLAAGRFDCVVCCTGSTPVRPSLKGVTAPNVVLATDLLIDRSLAESAEHVLVVGGGDVGCETAHMLAYECGKQVTVVELSAHFMQGSCTANRGYLIHYLERKGVELWNCSRVQEIRGAAVDIVRNVSRTVPSPYAVWEPVLPGNVHNPFTRHIDTEEQEVTLAFDLVVLATGLRSNDDLYRRCVTYRVAPDIRNIGDSFRPGRIFDATKAGYAAAISL
jgi:2-enoate reductase